MHLNEYTGCGQKEINFILVRLQLMLKRHAEGKVLNVQDVDKRKSVLFL